MIRLALIIASLASPAAAMDRSDIIGIYDGDTFTVMTDGGPVKVRPEGYDAPELRGAKCDREYAHAVRAREELVRILDAARSIEIVQTGRFWSKIIAAVTVDGVPLAHLMGETGFTRVYHASRGREPWCWESWHRLPFPNPRRG